MLRFTIQFRKLLQDRRGAQMVETALILAAFLFMLLGAFDFCEILFVHQSMVERTRAAARYAEVNLGTDLPTIQNLINYGQTTVPVNSTPAFGLAGGNITDSAASNGDVSSQRKITVSNYQFSALSPMGGTFTMRPIVVAYTQQN
jgi:Flp pilus assembly protein TadG